ncbi:MAG: PQQ-like beta-propeller repeat protein [Acidobacteria bacterium]|nr:PQQ-like beta-propeller repeat protein [Acidobacteriota bacterium]
MNKRYRRRILYFTLSAAFIFVALAAWPAAAAQMDHRNVAVGPDGTTYVVAESMDMMDGGIGGQGMQLTLYAVGPNNQVIWSYRLEGHQATAPAVATNGTVYVATFAMPTDRDRHGSNTVEQSRLFAIKGGTLKWSFEFNAQLPSAPVPGPNGNIFISTNCWVAGEMNDGDDMERCEQNGGEALLAIEDRGTRAALLWSRDLEAMMISEPVVEIIDATNWFIAVSGLFRERGGVGGDMMGSPVLFRFRPNGSFETIRLAGTGHL